MTRRLSTDAAGRSPAPAGTLAEVIKAGRRRRLLWAGGGGSAATLAVIVAVVAVASLGTSHGDTLRQLGPASAPHPTAAASGRVAQPRPGTPTAPLAVASGAAVGGAPGGGAAPATANRPGSVAVPAAHRGNKQPVTRSTNRYGAVCTGDNSGVGGGTSGLSTAPWCITATVSGSAAQLVFDVQICRDPAAVPADVNFPTSQEVDYSIANAAGRTIWVWSAGQAFAQSTHSLHFAAGDCYQWQTRWDGLADDGRRVATGQSLVLRAHSTAGELRRRQASQSFRN